MSQLNLTPAQTRFVYLFNGLAPIATSVATPIVTYLQLRRKPLSESQRKLLLIQEVARQMVSCSIGLISYFGGAMLTGRLVKNAARKSLAQIVGGTLISFLGYGFVRPMISTELLVRWMQQHADLRPEAATPPEARLRHFMQGIETKATRFRGQAFTRLA